MRLGLEEDDMANDRPEPDEDEVPTAEEAERSSAPGAGGADDDPLASAPEPGEPG